jgi:hypothetical protein
MGRGKPTGDDADAALVVFSIATIWPLQKKIALSLDIWGGTSFLIRLQAR